jgi:2-polyprenyl-3-methyl-5-hydroxy-6-metoxy-1,4-benzoquinol methylase
MKAICRCRVCGSDNTNYLGLLPKQTHFAGKLLDQNLPESALYQCNDCLIVLRDPVLSVSQYNILYEQASSKVWSNSNKVLRYDQAVVREMIFKKNKMACKVLDVGCYTAELLASLPENYLKYGVEMSKDAATVSSSKGVSIIGNDLYNINTSEKFDFIIAVDVIEHTHNPEEFIRNLASMLEPQGELIISTGNSDSWLWGILKNRFWYCKFPEHISFIGEKWLDSFCWKSNFTITDKHIFSYTPISYQGFIKNAIKFFLSIMRISPERFSNTTKDHFCFAIQKKQN